MLASKLRENMTGARRLARWLGLDLTDVPDEDAPLIVSIECAVPDCVYRKNNEATSSAQG